MQLDFPTIERTTLSNGLRVTYAQRKAAPLTHVLLSFNAGMSADSPGARGLQNMTMSMLDEGTATRTSQQIAEEKERLGASLNSASGVDRSTVILSALTANLAPSLDLMTDIVEHPAFNDGDIERIRSQLLTSIAQARTTPNSMAARELPLLLYGPNHPYGGTQLGSPAAVKGFTRAQLIGFKDRWLRPDNAELFVVSDSATGRAQARARGGVRRLARAGGAARHQDFHRAAGASDRATDRADRSPGIAAVGDLRRRADARRSAIRHRPLRCRRDGARRKHGLAHQPGSARTEELVLWRLWCRPVAGNAAPFLVVAPVQADRTGDSVAELVQQLKGITTTNGVTGAELQQAVATQVGALPGEFETGGAVLEPWRGWRCSTGPTIITRRCRSNIGR